MEHDRVDDSSRVSESSSPWGLLAILIRNSRFVLGLPLAAAVVAIAVTWVIPPGFTAGASFVAESDTRSSVGGALGQLGGELGLLLPQTSPSVPLYYAEVLRGETVLRSVVNALFVHQTGSDSVTLGTMLLGRVPSTPSDTKRAVQKLRDRLSVDVDRVTGVVHFTVTLPDSKATLDAVEMLLKLVNDHNLRRRQEHAQAEGQFLQARIERADSDLVRAEDAMAEFLKKNRQLANAPDLQYEQQRLLRQLSLRQQLYVSLTQTLETNRVTALRTTPTLAVVEPSGNVATRAPRQTLRYAALALVLGAFFGLVASLVSEAVLVAKRSGDSDFLIVSQRLQSLLARVRAGASRR
jgi:uncharacterized protein involved in exopolysaccharide biosynthesis